MKTEVAVICLLFVFDNIQAASVPEECECNNPSGLQNKVDSAKNAIKYLNNLKNDYKDKLINKLDDYQKRIEGQNEIPLTQISGGHDINPENEYTFHESVEFSNGFENDYESDEEPNVQINGGNYYDPTNTDSSEEEEVPSEQFTGQGNANEGQYNGLGNDNDSYYDKPNNNLGSYGKEDNRPGDFENNYYEEYHVQYGTPTPNPIVPSSAADSTQKPLPSNFQTTVYTSSKGEPGKTPVTQTTVVTGTPKPNYPTFPAKQNYPTFPAYPSFPPSAAFGFSPLSAPPILPSSVPTRVPGSLQNFGQFPTQQNFGQYLPPQYFQRFPTPQNFGPAVGAFHRAPKYGLPAGYVRF